MFSYSATAQEPHEKTKQRKKKDGLNSDDTYFSTHPYTHRVIIRISFQLIHKCLVYYISLSAQHGLRLTFKNT